MTSSLVSLYMVPGLPHVLQCADKNDGYAQLNAAMAKVGDEIRSSGVKRIVYFSTSWLAVLDQMFQARERLAGTHVDENWYEYGNLDYDIRIDQSFASTMAKQSVEGGYTVKMVDYDGFPLDTGTLVANKLVNSGNLPANIVANNVYLDFAGLKAFAATLQKAVLSDDTPTAVVVVGGMSGRFFTTPIDEREDYFHESKDDEWNQKMIQLMCDGQYDEVERLVPEFAGATKAEMGWKHFAFLRGMMPAQATSEAKLYAYAPIYGTGGAVIRYF